MLFSGLVLVRFTVLGLSAGASVPTACAPGLALERKRIKQLSMKPRSCSPRSVCRPRKVSSASPTSPADTGSPRLGGCSSAFEFQEAIKNEAMLCKEKMPISIFNPLTLERTQKGQRLCVFSVPLSYLIHPHTSALLTLKSVFHCPDPILWSCPLLGS